MARSGGGHFAPAFPRFSGRIGRGARSSHRLEAGGTFRRRGSFAATTRLIPEGKMGRYALLWLLGVPIPILLLIYLFGGLH
jgi:hypothetical protein